MGKCPATGWANGHWHLVVDTWHLDTLLSHIEGPWVQRRRSRERPLSNIPTPSQGCPPCPQASPSHPSGRNCLLLAVQTRECPRQPARVGTTPSPGRLTVVLISLINLALRELP